VKPEDATLYDILIPTGVTLLVLALVLGFEALAAVSRGKRMQPVVRRRESTGEFLPAGSLSRVLEESESLANSAGNPFADPAIHLRGAVRILPSVFADAVSQIMDGLESRRVVILDLGPVDEALALRLVDFCCGVTLVGKGWFYRVSSTTVVLTPNTGQK
jgi:hypothetical protein